MVRLGSCLMNMKGLWLIVLHLCILEKKSNYIKSLRKKIRGLINLDELPCSWAVEKTLGCFTRRCKFSQVSSKSENYWWGDLDKSGKKCISKTSKKSSNYFSNIFWNMNKNTENHKKKTQQDKTTLNLCTL